MLIMVLNDGETFTNLDGCVIVEVPDDLSTDQIEELMEQDGDVLVASFIEVNGKVVIGIDSKYLALRSVG